MQPQSIPNESNDQVWPTLGRGGGELAEWQGATGASQTWKIIK